jgi:hypothetical protein
MRLGLLCTVLADYFLILDNLRYFTGVCLYIAAQIFYNFRVERKPLVLALRFGGAGVLAAVLWSRAAHPLIIVSVVYAWLFFCYCLSVTLIFMRKAAPKVNARLMFWSAAANLLGDLTIALMQSGTAFGLQHLRTLAVVLWVFYGPSQVLMALSARRYAPVPAYRPQALPEREREPLPDEAPEPAEKK